MEGKNVRDRTKPYLTGQRWAFRWDTSDQQAEQSAEILSQAHGRRYQIEDSMTELWLVDVGPLERPGESDD